MGEKLKMAICKFCVQTMLEISLLTAKEKRTEKKKNLHGLHKSVTITGGPIPGYFVPDTRDLFFNQNRSG